MHGRLAFGPEQSADWPSGFKGVSKVILMAIGISGKWCIIDFHCVYT